MPAESTKMNTKHTEDDKATRGVTLRELLTWAERHVSPDLKRARGRTSFNARFEIERLTPGQYQDILTAANIIADTVGDGVHGEVAGRWFRWDDCAGPGGRGDWTLCEHVKEWTMVRARERAEAREKPWSHKRARAYANKTTGAIRNLLDLAANHRWIERTDEAPQAADVYAGRWEGEVERWIDEVAERNEGCNLPTISRGVKVLAVFAARTGARSRGETDWMQVRRIIEQRFDDDSLARQERNAARYVWRRDPQLTGLKSWLMRGDNSLRLVSETAIRAAINDADFADWTDENGRPLTAFISGRYGVSRWLQWVSLSDIELEMSDLPPREFIDPTPNQARWAHRRRRKGRSPLSLGKNSRRVRLGLISAYAGWATREGAFDGQVHGLDVLCDPKLLVRFAAAQERRRGKKSERRHGGHTDHGESILAKCLALIASPFLEAVARQNGDEVLADRLSDAAEKLKIWGYRRQPRGTTKKKVDRIVRVWSTGGRDGYLRMIDLVELLIAEAEDRVSMTLAQTVKAIREDGFEPPSMWATAVRGALLIAVLRRIPYRLETISSIELGHWQTMSVGRDNGRPLQRWEGAIYLALPGHIMKSGEPFDAAFIADGEVGDPVVERLTYRTLIEAYLMRGGARDRLLMFDGTLQSSPYLFPASAGHGAGRHGRYRAAGQQWKPSGIRGWLQRTIVRLAPELGLDSDTMDGLWGGATAHAFRALFNSYWERRDPEYSRVMLHHAPTDVTSRHYSGLRAWDETLEVSESEITWSTEERRNGGAADDLPVRNGRRPSFRHRRDRSDHT